MTDHECGDECYTPAPLSRGFGPRTYTRADVLTKETDTAMTEACPICGAEDAPTAWRSGCCILEPDEDRRFPVGLTLAEIVALRSLLAKAEYALKSGRPNA